MDQIVGRSKPLNYPAVLDSPIPFHIMVTDVDSLTTRVPGRFESRHDLYQALQASMWLPLAARGTTRFRDYNAIDGGVLVAHPFMIAERDETVTHILSLSTRPMGSMRANISTMNRFVGLRLNRTRKGLGPAHIEAVRAYKNARVRIEAQRTKPTQTPAILDLAPMPQRAEVIRHESSSWLLLEGARTGYEVVYAAFEGKWRRPMLRLVVPDHNREHFPYPTHPDVDA
jgi:hypothetical protein